MATETYELRIEGVNMASYRETVLHFSGVGVASGDTLAAGESLITGFRASLESLFLTRLPASYNLMMYSARRVSPKPSAVARTGFDYGALAGSVGSASVGQQICPVIFLVPTMGTKSGGKIFVPAVSAGDIINSAYTGPWKTAWANFIVAAQAGFAAGGITWTLAIYSRKHNTTSPVTSFAYSPVIGFQSKRRKPVGAVG